MRAVALENVTRRTFLGWGERSGTGLNLTDGALYPPPPIPHEGMRACAHAQIVLRLVRVSHL